MNKLQVWCWAGLSVSLASSVWPGDLTDSERALLSQRERGSVHNVLAIDIPAEQRLLKTPSRAIAPTAASLPRLLAEMERAMHAGHGGGLAAVQVGIPVRLVLLRRRDTERGEWLQAFVNPLVVAQSAAREVSWERCLSVPWGYRYIERAAWLKVRYQAVGGGWREDLLRDDEAAVFQQEWDHLDGHLLSDGQGRERFIPAAQMGPLMAEVARVCQGLGQAACRELSRRWWEEGWNHRKAP